LRGVVIITACPIHQLAGAMHLNRSKFTLFLASFFLSVSFATWAQEVSGLAEVRSGNEVILNGAVVQLFGLQAPAPDDRCDLSEGQYRCGIVAWAELVKLADGRDISCDIEAHTDKGQPLATCYLGEMDINEALVRSGWAEARADVERYQPDQDQARRARRGLWAERIRPPDRRQAP